MNASSPFAPAPAHLPGGLIPSTQPPVAAASAGRAAGHRRPARAALVPGLCLAAALMLAACGPNGEPSLNAEAEAAGSYGGVLAQRPAPAPAARAAPAAAAPSATEADGGLVQRHIAVRHELDLVVAAAEIPAAWKALAERCARLDCEVITSTLRRELPDEPGGAELEMRINPKDTPDLLGAVDGLGRVASHSTSSEDKTAQVIDVQAHIRNRTEFRDSLRTLLQRADGSRKLADVLEIQRTLSETQAELDSDASQLKALAQQTTRQHVVVHMRPQASLAEGSSANPIWAALRNAGKVMARSFAGVVTLTAAALPWLLVLAALGWLLKRLWRRWRQRKAVA